MKVVNNKIIEISETELYQLYLDREMDDCMSFCDYINKFIDAGCKIIEEGVEDEIK